MSKKRTLIIHPYILAIYPILFFYNLNKHEVWFSEAIIPIAASLAATFLLLFFLKFIFKETTKAGILTSFILVLFFFYEAIQTGLAGNNIGDLVLSLDPNLFWSYGILFALAVTGLHFWKVQNTRITEYLNFVTVILIILPLIGLTSHKISSKKSDLFFRAATDHAAISENFKYTGPKPDIYYIILDGYMRNDVMKEFWGFDNSEFTNFLTNRGFYVASKSRSNYSYTALSLPSSLNMQYLNTEDENFSDSHLPLIEMIDDNKVVKFAKALGYKYIHLSDGTAETKKSRHADLRLAHQKHISSFSYYLINKTWMKSLSFSSFDPIEVKREQILFGFKALEDIPNKKEPTFTFAHFVAPHEPFVFDKNGGTPSQDHANAPLKYFEQAIFVNGLVKKLVDNILNKSKLKPIIIIQGDHGIPFMTSNHPKSDELRKTFSILNAYYLPVNARGKLYEHITPVNSFRLVFDHYFGTELGFLPDKVYFPTSYTAERHLISIPDEDDLLNDGNRAWVNQLKDVIRRKPNFPEAHAMLGIYYSRLDRFPEAIISLEKALLLNPDLIWAYINLAVIYSGAGNYSKALDAIHQAIRMNPKIAEAHKTLGEIKMATGNHNEAISAFNKAIKISPKYTGAISGLGRVHSLLNDKKKSLLYFKKLVLISQSFDSYNDLGAAYARFGLNKEAILNFKKVLEINPRSAAAYYNLGNIYIKEKNYQQGINLYQKAIENKPDYVQAYFKIGTTYEILNQPIKAAEYYQNTLALNSKHTLARFGLGNAFLKSKQMGAALLEYQRALKLNPDHIPSYVNLGTAQMRLGRFDQGRKTYETILLKKPSMAKIHKYLGIIHTQMQESPDKAVFHLQEYIRLAPNQPDVAHIQSMVRILTSKN